MENFSENLVFLRNKLGLKQQEVADNLDISRTVYSDYERGRSEPNLRRLFTISKYYNVPIDWLFLDTASLMTKIDDVKNEIECMPNCMPKRMPNEEKTPILSEPEVVYNTPEIVKSKDIIIANQQEIINTQKTLINALNTNISLLQSQLEEAKKKP